MTANIKQAEAVFKALANRRRITIFQLLRAKRELTVGDIAEGIKLSFKATSRHLSLLKAAGIIEKEQRGLFVYYYISSEMTETARKATALL